MWTSIFRVDNFEEDKTPIVRDRTSLRERSLRYRRTDSSLMGLGVTRRQDCDRVPGIRAVGRRHQDRTTNHGDYDQEHK